MQTRLVVAQLRYAVDLTSVLLYWQSLELVQSRLNPGYFCASAFMPFSGAMAMAASSSCVDGVSPPSVSAAGSVVGSVSGNVVVASSLLGSGSGVVVGEAKVRQKKQDKTKMNFIVGRRQWSRDDISLLNSAGCARVEE